MKNKISFSLLFGVLFAGVVIAATETPRVEPVESLRGDVPISDLDAAPGLKFIPKSQNPIARNYINQPPLIPHSIAGFQINLSNNACLQCHDVNSQVTGALKIPPTHYLTRDNKLLKQVSPRRYFCLQCHVVQADAPALVGNDFTPVTKAAQ